MPDFSPLPADASRPLPPPVGPALRGAAGWGLVASLYAVAYEVARRMPVGAVATRAITNVGLLPLPILVAVLGTLVARRLPRGDRARRAWGLIAAAFACEAVGDAVWSALEDGLGTDPAASAWVHVPYLAYYPLILAGLWSFGQPFRHRAERHRLLLDLVTTGTSAAVIVSHYLWSPEHLGGSGSLVPLAYPLGDLTTSIGLS